MTPRDARRVVAAAINHNDSGEIVSLPAPARHHDIIQHLARLGHPTPIKGTQGFVLDDGTFVMRRAALHIAESAKQLIREVKWVVRVFGRADDEYEREADARAEWAYLKKRGAIVSIYKLTVSTTEECCDDRPDAETTR